MVFPSLGRIRPAYGHALCLARRAMKRLPGLDLGLKKSPARYDSDRDSVSYAGEGRANASPAHRPQTRDDSFRACTVTVFPFNSRLGLRIWGV
jgi:hypothetical protein